MTAIGVTDPVTDCQWPSVTKPVGDCAVFSRYVTGMVTRPRKIASKSPRRTVADLVPAPTPAPLDEDRLFLRENREAQGVHVSVVAEALQVNEKSVYRIEKHPNRLTMDKQRIYATAIGKKPWELWHNPLPDKETLPKLDPLLVGAPKEKQRRIHRMAVHLLNEED